LTILTVAYRSDGPEVSVPGTARGPEIGPLDAAELCAEPYPTRREALEVARRLRSAGWVVVEHAEHPPRRPDGLSMIASVFHPVTYESPGDLLAPGPSRSDLPR
jgi:hypothetical protein